MGMLNVDRLRIVSVRWYMYFPSHLHTTLPLPQTQGDAPAALLLEA